MASRVQRVRRLSRARGFIIAACVVLAILVLQMATTVVAAVGASRQADQASLDTYGYVGDLTAERVARYAEAASDVTAGTSDQIARDPEVTADALAESMYLRLVREPTVRALYVGWPDGSFLIVRRDGSGYDVQQRAGAPGAAATSSDHDARFSELGETEIESNYEPRARPWYQAGSAAQRGAWTQPYLQFGSNETLVSAAQAARGDDGMVAVVGADLELESLGVVLDDLPLGDGAEAYVLAPDGDLIAAPDSMREQAEAVSLRGQDVANAEDLGLDMSAGPLEAEQDYVHRDAEAIVLERTVAPRANVDWLLYLSADESQLSPGLGRLSQTVFVITLVSLVVALAAIALAVRVWRPLRAMRMRASTDQLTGLANRHEFTRRGGLLVERATERGDTVVAVVLDLDNFKRLNDTYGHDVGDHALETVALALRENVRAGDLAARTGGDEFVVVQVLRRSDEPYDVVARTRDSIEHALHTRVEGGEGVGVTAGYATATAADRLDGLVARADEALVEGKRRAKGRVYGPGARHSGGDAAAAAAGPTDGDDVG